MIVCLSKSPLGRVLLITAGYLLVTFAVFRLPSQSALPESSAFSKVSRGLEIWQESRCHVCHSLYGLGGHLGPDLTNEHSLRGPEFIRAFVLAGRPGMPAYPEISESDMDALLSYLKHIDSTVEYPVRGSGIAPFGRIKKAAP